jgi:pimeloyl-ACP methyl ester carboxylesterase
MSGLWRFSKDTQNTLNKTRLPSGGWINLWLNIGHYEITQESAERFGFSSAAVDILRDAAQDPDFYEFTFPSAHAQSPDKVAFMPPGPERDEAIQKGIDAYKQWARAQAGKLHKAVSKKNIRLALYWLGYVIHGIQDLGPHGGMPNPEHAALDALKKSPDEDSSSVQLSHYYTQEFLRHIRGALGEDEFDLLRNWDGDGNLSKAEKEHLFGHGWDLSVETVMEFKKGGEKYLEMNPQPVSVRWPREMVFTEIIESLSTTRKMTLTDKTEKTSVIRTKPSFQPLGPAVSPQLKARWTVMVYMAGDDSNPNGIEYAVAQDLRELKDVGSQESVHFLVQTDEWREKNSYRYRLRKDTPLAADRLGVYRGDLNTGRIATLVEFVDWSVRNFPAYRYALVLWGHGSGHDDQDVYRLARGDISPRLASRLAQDRMGFFGRTSRAILEMNGPNKGYGFDSTAADFLDNRELKRAISAIVERIGRPLDLLGFDACLMANTEVTYQLRGLVNWMVASEQTEPGDGWSYREAFKGLTEKSTQGTKTLGKAIVHSFGDAYEKKQTLSLVNVRKIGDLAKNLTELSQILKDKDPAIFHRAATKATDLSPEGRRGYKDLGAFLRALKTDPDTKVQSTASRCASSYKEAIQANTGPGTGLTIYLPSHYNPYLPGSTDALYQLMDFPMECGWSHMLEKVNSPPGWDRSTASRLALIHRPFSPRFGGLYGIDRYNVGEILQGISPDRKVRHWVDLTRREIFSDMEGIIDEVLAKLRNDGPPKVRIFILPGMMGSQLSDRDGQHGLLWIDPVGLAIGSDFPALSLTPDGANDADSGVRIEAAGPIPLIYDKLAFCLMAAFGRSIDYLAYDWRKPVAFNGETMGERIARKVKGDGDVPIVLVAHSLGGLVAAKAIEHIKKKHPALHGRIKGMVAMGTPWKGSFNGALAMSAQGNTVENFALLTKWKAQDIANICQTFWGFSDTLPIDNPELLKPEIYAPGPIASSPYALQQLTSPLNLKAIPPANTLAIICDLFSTVNNLVPKMSGFEIEEGPGDGTVPLWSATAGGTLETMSVNQKHMTLPLDGKAIKATIDKVSAWTAITPKLLIDTGEIDKAQASIPLTRNSFVESLEKMDDKPLPLGTFTSMLFLG